MTKGRISMSVSEEEAFTLRQVLNYYSSEMDGVARAVSLHFAGKLGKALARRELLGKGG